MRDMKVFTICHLNLFSKCCMSSGVPPHYIHLNVFKNFSQRELNAILQHLKPVKLDFIFKAYNPG